MITYRRTPHRQNKATWLYYKNNNEYPDRFNMVAASKVPPIVVKQLNETGAPSVEYDDKPNLPRCIFCLGYKSHQRIFHGEMIALCNDHYYSRNIGQIAARMRIIIKEREDNYELEKSAPRRQKKQPKVAE